MARPRILIVGGSTRAAADSVRRAGWHPVCADLFADFDLRKTAEVIPVSDYPQSLPEDLRGVKADGWFYCGALENHPHLIEQILTRRGSYGPLLGTFPQALKLVRDPIWLAQTLQRASVPVLEVRDQAVPPDADGTWLQKPIASAGGRLIRVWDQAAIQSPIEEPHYFQQRIAGVGLSCLFRIENGQVEWLGASRKLNSNFLSHSPTQFTYCGSVGPIYQNPSELDSCDGLALQGLDRVELQIRATEIGRLLVQNTIRLQGLIGLDFRFDRGHLWLMEVNPRYTASVEVLELAMNQSLLNPDVNSQTAQISTPHNSRPRFIAKQILYASESLKVPDLSSYWLGDDPWKVGFLTDIPVPNSIVESGWPICTVLAEGPTWESVETMLNERLAAAKRMLLRV